jgi:hypothetical protein
MKKSLQRAHLHVLSGRVPVALTNLLITGLLVAAAGPTPSAQAVIDPGSIAGAVTDQAGEPLPGISVAVMHTNGFFMTQIGQGETHADGTYEVDGLAASTTGYLVRFTDPSGDYATEAYDDTLISSWGGGFPTSVPVTASSMTAGIDAALEVAASISGRLTMASGAPVSGGKVNVWWNPPNVLIPMDTDIHLTDQTGHYTIDRVKGGAYVLEFIDPVSGVHEFWNDRPDMSTANSLVITSGEALTGIDAALGGQVENLVAPTITGTAQVGQSLTASPGSWSPAGTAVTYRWIVGADTVPGDDPTGPVYVPTAADVGKTLRVHTTGTLPGWLDGSATSAPTSPVSPAPGTAPPPAPAPVAFLVRPRVKGTLEVGQVVRVSHGIWKPHEVVLKYQWYVGGKAITDATHRRLALTTKYVGKRLTVRIKAKAAGHPHIIVWTKPTARIKP